MLFSSPIQSIKDYLNRKILGGISIFSLLLVLGFENCLTIAYDSSLSIKLAFTLLSHNVITFF